MTASIALNQGPRVFAELLQEQGCPLPSLDNYPEAAQGEGHYSSNNVGYLSTKLEESQSGYFGPHQAGC
jgi:hypothetical protein